MDADLLLAELQPAPTDLVRFIERVVRDGMPYVVVPCHAVRAWQRHEPETWAKVTGWLAAHDVALVPV